MTVAGMIGAGGGPGDALGHGVVGSRWWRFDFHAHSPASKDFQQDRVSPQDWLLAFMRAGIDCVAVTDHNSGVWIDRLKQALAELEENPPAGYRRLTLFPGVEISANGGVHILAIFETGTGTADIDALLGAVGYLRGHVDGSDAVTEKSVVEVLKIIGERGALAIPAHVDQAKGLFKVFVGDTLDRVLSKAGLVAAIEVIDAGEEKPQLYRDRKLGWAEVLGSDSHCLTGSPESRCPGSRFTWIKMGQPTLDGLRLALIDGGWFSVRRSSDTEPSGSDPNRPPDDWIESIEISNARLMGQGPPQALRFNPALNAVVGGRGTGKSTVLHFLRIALGRTQEIASLKKDSEPRATFERFNQVSKQRSDPGGLRSDTVVKIVYRHLGHRYRLCWNQQEGTLVEEETGPDKWTRSASQDLARFPIRLFSQGQIQVLAGDDTRGLLALIRDATGEKRLWEEFARCRERYLSLRARARELRGKLGARDRLEGQVQDVRNKLAQFEATEQAQVLRAYQQGSRQQRELAAQRVGALALVDRITALAGDVLLPDSPDALFNPESAVEAEMIERTRLLQAAVAETSSRLEQVAEALRCAINDHVAIVDGSAWHQGWTETQEQYHALVRQLEAIGVKDTAEHSRLVQERQRLETELTTLKSTADQVGTLEAEAEGCLRTVAEVRKQISDLRDKFLSDLTEPDKFIRITLERFGRNPELLEDELRVLLGIEGDRFKSDIRDDDGGSGIVAVLLEGLSGASAKGAGDRPAGEAELTARLEALKARLTKAMTEPGGGSGFGGHFSNYLQREYQKRPELLDRLLCWFPSDTLAVSYSRGGHGQGFQPISQGSAGQRASALLAFVLAFGKEPIVLDQPEDDLDNHVIYDLVVRKLRDSKQQRQIIVVTHNPNIVVNGDAEMIHAMDFRRGQCCVVIRGCLQEQKVREEICRVMEGGREAFERRYRRIGREPGDV